MNSHIHFQLPDNGVMRSPRRRKFHIISLVFTCLCFSKSFLKIINNNDNSNNNNNNNNYNNNYPPGLIPWRGGGLVCLDDPES